MIRSGRNNHQRTHNHQPHKPISHRTSKHPGPTSRSPPPTHAAPFLTCPCRLRRPRSRPIAFQGRSYVERGYGTRRAQIRLDPPPGDSSSSCPAPTLLVHCQRCCGKSICGYIHLRTIGSCALALRYRGIRDRGASAINEQPP